MENKWPKCLNNKFIYESAENTATAPPQPAKPPQTTAAPDVSAAATQDGDLVLSIKITDFSWYCNNNKDRWSIQKDWTESKINDVFSTAFKKMGGVSKSMIEHFYVALKSDILRFCKLQIYGHHTF